MKPDISDTTEAGAPSIDHLTDAYPCFLSATWRVVIGRGSLTGSFGPYTAPEAGEIIARCMEEGIPAFLRAECSQNFDWVLARDLRDASEARPEVAR